MITAVFVISTAICAVGWLTRSISCAALIYYIEKSGYKLPDNQDLEECTHFAAKKLFKL
ncbi:MULTISPECIES: hypothetical protein [Blautia]|uniref:Uncharacterized protein n=1 Tax=Myoviridae sp. ctino4 TaxID=2826686 RepID=A0A8S5MTI2_9CAUD|nr:MULTISPECIES: hypothetical protein [Blautia]MCM1902920.1 hypothetical protein [Blautia sp. MB18-30]DAD85653.1 MAG TPA: hypothetical protein [Myoviridae sp. ctino4]